MNSSTTANMCLRRVMPAVLASEIMQFACDRACFTAIMHNAYTQVGPAIRRIIRRLVREWSLLVPRAATTLIVGHGYAECMFGNEYENKLIFEEIDDGHEPHEDACAIDIPSHIDADDCIRRSLQRQFEGFAAADPSICGEAWRAVSDIVHRWYWCDCAIYRHDTVARVGAMGDNIADEYTIFVETISGRMTIHSINLDDHHDPRSWFEGYSTTRSNGVPQLVVPAECSEYRLANTGNGIVWYYPTHE